MLGTPSLDSCYGAAVATFGSGIYVVGGISVHSASRQVRRMSLEGGGRWRDGPQLQVARASCAAVVARGQLLAIGGHNGRRALREVEFLHQEMCCCGNSSSGDVELVSWHSGPPLCTARKLCAAAVWCGQAFVMGGVNETNWYLDSTECLEGTAWQFAAAMRQSRADFAATALRDQSVVVVGGDDGWRRLASVEVLPPASSEWCQLLPQLPLPRSGAAACLLGEELWVIGGYDGLEALSSCLVLASGGGHWRHAPPLHSRSGRVGLAVATCRNAHIAASSKKCFADLCCTSLPASLVPV